MGQFLKNKESDINLEFKDYFYLNDLKNYEMIYLINDKDYKSIINSLGLNEITIISKDGSINDDNPIYTNLKIFNNSKIIYLKEFINLLSDDSIKSYISSFKGIIICEINLISYLKELNLINEIYNLNNNYLKIDRLGNAEEVII